jgi:hypothetical protein
MKTVFPHTPVNRASRSYLHAAGLLNENHSVISWARLSPFLSDRVLTEYQCRQLITIEVNAKKPRREIVLRLTRFYLKLERERILSKINQPKKR